MKTCNSGRYGSAIHAWPAQPTLPNKSQTGSYCWQVSLDELLNYKLSQPSRILRGKGIPECFSVYVNPMKRWRDGSGLKYELWRCFIFKLDHAIPNWTLQVLEGPWRIRLFEFSNLRTRRPNTLDRFARPCPGGSFPSTLYNSGDKSIGGDFLYLFDFSALMCQQKF